MVAKSSPKRIAQPRVGRRRRVQGAVSTWQCEDAPKVTLSRLDPFLQTGILTRRKGCDHANTLNISGVRIWLAGSVPTGEESERLLRFVKTFAAECFRAGAIVLHGCHPSLTQTLLTAAAEYRNTRQRTATLRLIASAAYQEPSGGYAGVSVEGLRMESEFRTTPIVRDQEGSLAKMREILASEADVLVAIGGKWWREAPTTAGVPTEFKLAIQRGIPSFLLGD